MLDLISNEIVRYLQARHPLDPADRGLGGIYAPADYDL
jgi:hypothetical protein